MTRKHPRSITQQAEDAGDKAENLFASVFAGQGLMPRAQLRILALVKATVKAAFLNGWDAAIGDIDDSEPR